MTNPAAEHPDAEDGSRSCSLLQSSLPASDLERWADGAFDLRTRYSMCPCWIRSRACQTAQGLYE